MAEIEQTNVTCGMWQDHDNFPIFPVFIIIILSLQNSVSKCIKFLFSKNKYYTFSHSNNQ